MILKKPKFWDFKKPNFCDIIGSILYDQDLFKIDFLANKSKTSKKRGISGFFTWLDQYIQIILYLVNYIDDFEHKSLKTI